MNYITTDHLKQLGNQLNAVCHLLRLENHFFSEYHAHNYRADPSNATEFFSQHSALKLETLEEVNNQSIEELEQLASLLLRCDDEQAIEDIYHEKAILSNQKEEA